MSSPAPNTIYGNISLVQLIDDRAVCHQYASGTYKFVETDPSQPLQCVSPGYNRDDPLTILELGREYAFKLLFILLT